jgi:hypothetical protein
MKRIPEASCGTGKMAVTQGKSLDSVGCHDGGEVPRPRPQKLALFLSGNKSKKAASSPPAVYEKFSEPLIWEVSKPIRLLIYGQNLAWRILNSVAEVSLRDDSVCSV